jgi:Ca2+-binding EF-hand superfamily protein
MAGVADDNFLRGVFGQVDANRSGTISAEELQGALTNGNWKPFKLRVVHMMVDMFDQDKNGTINYEEFRQLWQFIQQWSQSFQSLDRDKSGLVNDQELAQALASFGYRFSPTFSGFLVSVYDTEKKGGIEFDQFIHLCVSLHNMTGSFRALDTDQDGMIDISYEAMLSMVVGLKM